VPYTLFCSEDFQLSIIDLIQFTAFVEKRLDYEQQLHMINGDLRNVHVVIIIIIIIIINNIIGRTCRLVDIHKHGTLNAW
jgi:hypothetical protein